MTRPRRTGAIASTVVWLGLTLVPASAAAQSAELAPLPGERDLVHGREATLRVGGNDLKGELLAVTVDSLWLLTPGKDLRVLSLRLVEEVRVRRHALDADHALLWTGIGALVTGALLTAACTQVENAECGPIFPATIASWGILGGLFSWRIAVSSRHKLGPVESQVRPYVRFPQGLPEGFDPR